MATSSGPAPTPAAKGAALYYVPTPPSLDEGDGEGGFKLQTLLKVLRRRRRTFVLVVVAVTAIAGARALANRVLSPVYAGGFTLLISDPVNEASTAGGGSGEGGAISSVARNESRIDVPTLIQVLQSPVVLEPVYTQLAKQFPDRSPPSINVSLVTSGAGGQSFVSGGVLAVSSRGGDVAMVRKALELSEASFLEWSLDQRRQKLTEGVKFLDEQAPLLQARSNKLQEELQKFRTRHNVLAPEEEAQAVRGRVEELRGTLLTQQAELQRLQQVRSAVAGGTLTARSFSSSAGGESGAGGGTGLSLDVPNQSELSVLTKLEEQIAAARAVYQPGAPMLADLVALRDRLRPELLRKELQAVDAALAQQSKAIASTRTQIVELEGRFKSQPPLLREFQELKGKLDIAESNLAGYQRTREQFQLEIAQNNVPWKVIAPVGVNPTPVEPDLNRGLMQGLLLGLLAGTGAALLHDRLDHVFHSPGEVREDLRKPLLGHIPHISFFKGVRRSKRFLLKELDTEAAGLAGYERFSYQEAFRNLYTSLRFLNSDRQVRSVAVSSSIPGEGKSLAIVLLAKTLCELGQRVLLVDADLRKPQMHLRLGLDNIEGLTTLLTDDQRHWREVVQTLPDYPSWDVLTAGRRPPDPPRLLSSARMAELVKEIAATGNYDLILYDTPPTLGLADAALVAEQLDGILLLVSLNRVDRSLPAQALERIEAAGAPLLGVVTNARVARDELQRPYTGGYGYGYGGYGGDDPYDPAVAYSYYQSEAAEGVEQRSALQRLLPNQRNRRMWAQGLRRWLNG
ncbi:MULTISPECIES: polysaccharide biosynthesis tyrosine autokinase [Aphanothece]|uniref:polysaccharide biosynthesis tyrosine autokinase n=1 Tax=Aphanothece TaxID=1121 RepID=UPI003984EBA3